MTHSGVSAPNWRTTDILNNSIITYSKTIVHYRLYLYFLFLTSACGSVKINVYLGFGLSSPTTSCSLTKVEHPAVVVTHHMLSPPQITLDPPPPSEQHYFSHLCDPTPSLFAYSYQISVSLLARDHGCTASLVFGCLTLNQHNG